MKKIRIPLFLIALLSIISVSCKYQQITVGKPAGLKVNEIKTGNVSLQVDLPVNNPNNFSFTLKKIDLDVYVGEINVGNVKRTQKTRIEAKSNDVHAVDVSFKPAELLGNSFKIVSELSRREIEIGVKGKVKVGRFIFSKNIDVDSKDKVKIY